MYSDGKYLIHKRMQDTSSEIKIFMHLHIDKTP